MGSCRMSAAVAMVLAINALAAADLPRPIEEKEMSPFPIPWQSDLGVMSASALLDKPAGHNGGIVVRNGHFYSGEQRVRFWGVNTCFAADFPTHDQADQVAARLASLGVNCVRIHHGDNQAFPNGIFADNTLDKLSPQALERLDYFVAALKKQGVYVDLNLHVSRWVSKARGWNVAGGPGYDKIADLFYPDLIDAQKQYARDLLGHVNAYTKNRYADEPAVAIVEINNEDTMFLWGGDEDIAQLPDPFGSELTRQWNQWLLTRYETAAKLKDAWAAGSSPLGENQIAPDSRDFQDLHQAGSHWVVEQHEQVKVSATVADKAVKLDISNIDATSWHAQFGYTGLTLKKGQFYTVKFHAWSPDLQTIALGVSQAHDPWGNLGLGVELKLRAEAQTFSYGFEASANEPNARISFSIGQKNGTLMIDAFEFCAGGREGLRQGEDPAKGTVARRAVGDAVSPRRSIDWFDFVQGVDQSFFVSMRDFLKKDIGVKCPITGTIALGGLGMVSQSKMDFVDAHAYWDHPQFPRKPWDAKDWLIHNKPMADDPEGATLWSLAATRVQGMPFTVTEYNHAAPNEWQAECVPMIASYAALQDWDGVFLFAFSHTDKYDSDAMDNFFDLKGALPKLAEVPMGARIFLGNQMRRLGASTGVAMNRTYLLGLMPKHYFQAWDMWRDEFAWTWQRMLTERRVVCLVGPVIAQGEATDSPSSVAWTASGPGTGRYQASGASASVFAGFVGAEPVDLGRLRIDHSATPFISLMVCQASEKSMLLSVVGRGGNTGMVWNDSRTSVGNQWGKGPAIAEMVDAVISVPASAGHGPPHVYALDGNGQRAGELKVTGEGPRWMIDLSQKKSLWYEIVSE